MLPNAGKTTIYKTLKAINDIDDPQKRREGLRNLCNNNRYIVIILQRVFEPDYRWDFTEEDIANLKYREVHHDTCGSFYQSLKRWNKFIRTPVGLTKQQKLVHLALLCEDIDKEDVQILFSVIRKKLPFENLTEEFVVKSVPEIYSKPFREKYKVDFVEKPFTIPTIEQPKPVHKPEVVAKFDDSQSGKIEITRVGEQKHEHNEDNTFVPNSARYSCREFFKNNKGLSKQEYLDEFISLGAAKNTAKKYYYELMREERR